MKKIAIIEDDLIVANIYRNKFSVDGFQVEIAADGAAGMEMVKDFKPDVLLLDLMLPVVSGLDLLKNLRRSEEFKELPVIVFSSTYLTNVVQEAWKAGATKCLSKANCSPKQIIEVVRTTLKMPATSFGTQATADKPRASSAKSSNTALAARNLDLLFQGEIQRTFNESLPATRTAFQTLLQNIIKAENESLRLEYICDLCRRVHALTGNAALAGDLPVAQLADALEVLLRELYEKPQNINPSTLRTVASGLEFLGVLFQTSGQAAQTNTQPKILVVDDDPIALKAVTFALEKARLKSMDFLNPTDALHLATDTKFDLIFLDVDMPNLNGFELCKKLRASRPNSQTPVVFVTNLNDFEGRANATMSGGNDFIAKPFMFIELAVKALVHVLRRQSESVQN